MSVRDHRRSAGVPQKIWLPRQPSEGRRANMSSAARASKRTQLVARDGLTCWLCKGRMRLDATGEDEVTLDHVVAMADDGSHDLRNLRLAHRRCNEERGRLQQARRQAHKTETT